MHLLSAYTHLPGGGAGLMLVKPLAAVTIQLIKERPLTYRILAGLSIAKASRPHACFLPLTEEAGTKVRWQCPEGQSLEWNEVCGEEGLCVSADTVDPFHLLVVRRRGFFS